MRERESKINLPLSLSFRSYFDSIVSPREYHPLPKGKSITYRDTEYLKNAKLSEGSEVIQLRRSLDILNAYCNATDIILLRIFFKRMDILQI